MSINQKIFSLPPSFTIDVKDMGLMTIATEKWTDQFVGDCLKAFMKGKLEQQRYGEKSESKKREDVEAQRRKFEAGEFEARTGSAATLTAAEEEFRIALAREFHKSGQKKSECDKMARGSDREELFRDLCIKPLYAKLGVEVDPETLQNKSNAILHTMKMQAENRAEALQKMRSENQISVEL